MNEWENRAFMADSKAMCRDEREKEIGSNRVAGSGVDGTMLKWILKEND
jgi:hypothetical protein